MRNTLLQAAVLLGLSTGVITSYGQDVSAIQHSDIFVTRTKSDKVFKQYHVSGLAWGFLPHPLNERTINRWRKNVKRVQAKGIHFQARIEFDARWENMIDYDPKGFRDNVMHTLDGDLLIAPWFKDRKHRGHPAYWFCSNAPGFREYLKYQADFVISGNPDFIMLDAQTSAALALKWYGACFCDHCLGGFNIYLDRCYTAGELESMGVWPVKHFNYAEYLKSNGYNDNTFINKSREAADTIPLLDIYKKYHIQSIGDLTAELGAYIDKQAGRHIPLSTSSPPHQPFRSVVVPEIFHYTLEMGQDAMERQVPVRTILNYKIAEAVQKKLIVTALPKQDWKLILDENRPGLVRTWIAQAYANGANFMVPVNQWASGHKRYKGNPADFTDMYDFIHNHAFLLDGYRAMAKTGLILSRTELSERQDIVESVLQHLVLENIPFRLIYTGPNDWDNKLAGEDLLGLNVVITPSNPDYLTDKQWETLSDFDGMIQSRSGEIELMEMVGRPITVTNGNDKLTVLPRENLLDDDYPYVCHLLNSLYDRETDRLLPQKDVRIWFDGVFFSKNISTALFYCPEEDPVELDMQPSENGFTIQIPRVADWGIVAFTSKSID